jgi:hypothetical protein
MIDVLTTVSTHIVGGVLLYAGIGHGRNHRAFEEALSSHQVLGSRGPRYVRLGVAVAEFALGLCISMTLFLGDRVVEARAWLLFAAALMLTSFAGYLLFLLFRRPGAPCGCSTFDVPVSGATVTRSAVLGVMAFIGALLPGNLMPPGLSAEFLIVSLCSFGLGLSLWILPEALSVPEPVLLEAGEPA